MTEAANASIEPASAPGVQDFLGGTKLEDGIGLCLSGGGFRAMLFHLGSFVRLNELGFLQKLERVASVSGGSIAAGALAVAWSELAFDKKGVASNLIEKVGEPILLLARWPLDIPAIALGLLPFVNAANVAAAVYDFVLLRGKTLQDLPERPRFVFIATSLQTGAVWRFAREYAAEWNVGEWRRPEFRVASVVGASAAFPPFFSPARIRIPAGRLSELDGAGLTVPPYTTRLSLTDGGVYDNLGLEPIWKRYRTILVSDGGLRTPAVPRPWANWLSVSKRATNLALQQGINMRIRVLYGLDRIGQRKLVHWGIGLGVDSYKGGNPLSFSRGATQTAAQVPTRLTRLPAEMRNLIMKAGYAHADAALRASGLLGRDFPAASFDGLPLLRP
ncbi:MAG TPA: patatin-like phospholipase family protein [Pseudaminobacter sp.]|nr:patatin-like phospholipase family protein [Pseudaminobacter sp.]